MNQQIWPEIFRFDGANLLLFFHHPRTSSIRKCWGNWNWCRSEFQRSEQRICCLRFSGKVQNTLKSLRLACSHPREDALKSTEDDSFLLRCFERQQFMSAAYHDTMPPQSYNDDTFLAVRIQYSNHERRTLCCIWMWRAERRWGGVKEGISTMFE